MDSFFSRKSFNLIYGFYKNSKFSIKQINKDIQDYAIQLDDYIVEDFKSYSDFFLRQFKPGKRKFRREKNVMGAFAEGRYLGFNKIEPDHRFPVKGQFLNSITLLEDEKLGKEFAGGPILICRLCPIDYHHFHYPDNGKLVKRYRVGGQFHSVNVLALKNKGDIFCVNEREVSILETDNFGKLAYIEVGAMCVGKIVQENPKKKTFKKGELKGHFEFGASTVIILGQKNRWTVSRDILKHSNVNRESFIKLGDEVAVVKG